MSQQTGNEIGGAIKHMKKSGTLWLVLFGFAAGIILLMIGSGSFGEDNDAADEPSAEKVISISEYERALEEDVVSLCMRVSGVSEVYVAVRLCDGGETVYASDTQIGRDGDTRSEYVIIGSGSSAHALALGERAPEIAGIGVVCRGGESINIRNELTALISAAYGIPMSRIYVTSSN